MSAHDDLERRLGDYYESQAPSRAPEWVLDRALDTIEATSQRRRPLPGWSWRLRPVRASGKLALTLVAIAAFSLVGLALVRRPTTGPAATPAPTAAPTPFPTLGVTPSVPPTPGPSFSAEQILAAGRLEGFAVNPSGLALTLWGTCGFRDIDCGFAWRLDDASRLVATGVIQPSRPVFDSGDIPWPIAAGDGFILLSTRGDDGYRIAADGTSTPLSMACDGVTWSTPTTPGRFVSVTGLSFVDTVSGARCDIDRLDGRSIAQAVFSPEGTLWGLVDNEVDEAGALTIGSYDGSGWRYHDFTTPGGAWTSVLAASGSTAVVLLANPEPSPRPDRLMGIAVTSDGGATWSETVDPAVLKRDLPFSQVLSSNDEDWYSGYTSMAFAGPSVLYVADGRGQLWRSTDLATFEQVSAPGPVAELRSAGDTVIARLTDEPTCTRPATCPLDSMVRISADGTVEPIIDR
jgi:hypothetical protein